MKLACVAMLLLGLAVHQAYACGKTEVCSKSQNYGRGNCASQAKAVDQTSNRLTNNVITKVNLYYSASNRCIKGVKPQYGWDAKNAALIGSSDKSYNVAESDIKLAAGENIVKVDIAAGDCVHYLKLTTSKGRTLSVGAPLSTTPVTTLRPTCATGYLYAFKGTQVPGVTEATSECTPLQSLGFVWGRDPCTSPEVAPTPRPSPVPSPFESPEPEIPSPPPTPSPVPSPVPSPIPSPDVCSPQPRMPYCQLSKFLCKDTCAASGWPVTALDCSKDKFNSLKCKGLVCKPLSASCIPTATQKCAGKIECSGGLLHLACKKSELIGKTCLIAACPVYAPKPAPAPKPAVSYGRKLSNIQDKAVELIKGEAEKYAKAAVDKYMPKMVEAPATYEPKVYEPKITVPIVKLPMPTVKPEIIIKPQITKTCGFTVCDCEHLAPAYKPVYVPVPAPKAYKVTYKP